MTALLALALLAPASELRDPYRVQIVVHIAKSRLMTDVFRQQVERELRDSLQAALGSLAKVSATDKHELLADIREKGLDRAVGSWRDRKPQQTHFVMISFDGTRYDIQTRMHDGLTGLPSPIGRSETTRDPAFVARLAALMLETDLALTGTITSEPDAGQQVMLDLRGGKLGDLSRWVKKDVLFSVARVPGAGAGQPQPSLFLQVLEPPHEGAVKCRVLRRYRVASMTGLKATLMDTRSGPLRLRLMQEGPRGLEPLKTPVSLQIRRHGFEGEEGSLLRLSTSGRRDVDTSKDREKGQFDRVAFVTVLSGTKVLAHIPVPLVSEGVTVVPVPRVNEEEGEVEDRYKRLLAGVNDALQVQNGMIEEINRLVKNPAKRRAAIDQVKKTLERMKEDHQALSKERQAVREEIDKMKDARSRPDLDAVDRRLKELGKDEKDLKDHVAKLETIEREENDPERREWLVKKTEADALRQKADVDEALAIYNSAPEKFKTEEHKKFVEDLEAKWKPVDAEHTKARTFIYQRWGKLTTAGVKENLEEARKALKTCINAGDKFGPAKCRELTLNHVTRMDAELKDLKPGVNPDDEASAMVIKELFPELRKLVEEAEGALPSGRAG